MIIGNKKQKFKEHLSEPLFKNSYYLLANTFVKSGSGFLFWIFAANFYNAKDIGLGAAIISATFLISIVSSLGFDIAIIRFLPNEKDKSDLINSFYTITILSSLLFSVIFLFGLHIWTPALIIIREHTIYGIAFVLFTIIVSLFLLQINVFIAFRQAKYSFIQTFISALRIIIMPFLVVLGGFGIYISGGLATGIAFLFGNMLILKVLSEYRPIPVIKGKMVYDILHYSFGNYIANIFSNLPTAVLPLIVVNIIGVESNAYFYIAWATSALLFMIPVSISTSLLAEGSFAPDKLRSNITKSLKLIFTLLIPAIILIYIFGTHFLLLFGKEYAENSFEVLVILSIASLPYAVNVVYVTVKRIKKEIIPVIYIYGAVAVITIAGSIVLIQGMGLIGIGISWAFGNGIMACILGLKLYRNSRI